jgi:hypothetical protein
MIPGPGELKVVMVMQAVRCPRCGETRWSLRAELLAKALELPCEMCGGPLVIERRRPGAGPSALPYERRSRLQAAVSRARASTLRQVVH